MPLPDMRNVRIVWEFLLAHTYLIKGIYSIKKRYEIDISNDIVCETHLLSILRLKFIAEQDSLI